MSDVSVPVCNNRVRPLLRLVSVAKKIKALTMLPSNVQSTDLPMDCMDWRLWVMRQSISCSTPAPGSIAAKQWTERTGSNDDDNEQLVLAYCRHSYLNQPRCAVFICVEQTNNKNLRFFPPQLFLPNSSLEEVSSQQLKIPPLVSQMAPVWEPLI